MRNSKIVARLVLILVSASTLLVAGCTTIDPGYRGIKVNLTGPDRGVQGLTVVTGRVMYDPISTRVIEYPVYTQTVKWTASPTEGSKNDDSITFTTQDSMIVNADISLSYSIDQEKVPQFYVKFRADNINDFTDGYLRNVVRNVFNEVAGKYTVEQVMGDNAPMLKQVGLEVNQIVSPYGVVIDPAGIGFIGAPRPPKLVLDRITEKVAAAQLALQKQNEVAQAEADAKKAVASAQGQADANKLLTASLNDDLIKWRQLDLEQQAINRWNGVRPQVEGNGGGMLLNVSPK